MRFRNVFLYNLSNYYPWATREQFAPRNQWPPAWLDANGRPVAVDTVPQPAGAVEFET